MGKPALAKLLIRIMKIVTSKTKATLMLDTSVYEAIKARVGLVRIWVNWLSSSWLGLIIVTILTLAIVQWQPIPNIIAKQMLTPKTGTPKLEKQMLTPKTGTPKLEMLTPKTGTPKLDIRFFCVK